LSRRRNEIERTCRVLDAKVVHRNKRARAYGASSGDNPGKAARIQRYTWPPRSRITPAAYIWPLRECKKREYHRRTCTLNAEQWSFERFKCLEVWLQRALVSTIRGERDYAGTDGRDGHGGRNKEICRFFLVVPVRVVAGRGLRWRAWRDAWIDKRVHRERGS